MGSYPSSSRGYANPYLPQQQQQADQYGYYYPYEAPADPTSRSSAWSEAPYVYPPPPPPAAPRHAQEYYPQGYFDDVAYPRSQAPSSWSSQQYYDGGYGGDSSFLSFLQGCTAALCCCWLLEGCCKW